jgi:hypothetical protein
MKIAAEIINTKWSVSISRLNFIFEAHLDDSRLRIFTITFQFSIHYVNKTIPKINQISSTGFLDFFQKKQTFFLLDGVVILTFRTKISL